MNGYSSDENKYSTNPDVFRNMCLTFFNTSVFVPPTAMEVSPLQKYHMTFWTISLFPFYAAKSGDLTHWVHIIFSVCFLNLL
jgi:hypothetical protein